jgi:hypothetical protein
VRLLTAFFRSFVFGSLSVFASAGKNCEQHCCRQAKRRDHLKHIEQLVCESSHEGIALWKGVDVVIALFLPIMTVLRKADSEQPCMGMAAPF